MTIKSIRYVICILLSVVLISSGFIISTQAPPTEGSTIQEVYTYESVYVGEYDSDELSGLAHIVFGQVHDTNDEYGIVITDAESNKSFAYEGKHIGEEGKFGIAIYYIPEGRTYYAQAYCGAKNNMTLGNRITFVSKSSNTCEHDYSLNSKETLYFCSKCDSNYPSGKESLDNTSDFSGSGYDPNYEEYFSTESQNYLLSARPYQTDITRRQIQRELRWQT